MDRTARARTHRDEEELFVEEGTVRECEHITCWVRLFVVLLYTRCVLSYWSTCETSTSTIFYYVSFFMHLYLLL